MQLEEQNLRRRYRGQGAALGLALGAAIGLSLGSVALGTGIGLALGVAIGGLRAKRAAPGYSGPVADASRGDEV